MTMHESGPLPIKSSILQEAINRRLAVFFFIRDPFTLHGQRAARSSNNDEVRQITICCPVPTGDNTN